MRKIEIKEKKAFISPYSSQQEYSLQWSKIDERWQGNTDNSHVSGKIKTIMNLTNKLGFISSSQLKKTFFAKDDMKQLKKYVKFGFLIRHELQNKHKCLTFFTLGPAGAKMIEKPYAPNWWLKYKQDEVLKRLILNQFFLRVYRSSVKIEYIEAPYPLCGIFIINKSEFPVVVIRGNAEDLSKDIRLVGLNKALIICEDVSEIEYFKDIEIPVRFLTDYGLCHVELNKAFYIYEKESGEIKNISLNIFEENT